MQLIKNLKQLGFKEFGKRWKKGIMRLTPEQLIKAEIQGYIGSILGTIGACLIFIFVYETMWAIAIVLFFNIIIQGSQMIGKYQTLQHLKKAQSQMIEFENLMEDKNGKKNTNEERIETIN